MKIALRSGHAYNTKAGGYKALYWHIKAFLALNHSVDFYTTGNVSTEILQNWFNDVPIRFYQPGVEKNYDCVLDLDHFSNALPLAPLTIKHTFFPMGNVPAPDEKVKVYSNSAYTARHIKHIWGRDAIPMYIPIDNHFRSADKQKIILHVSRFSEPSEYADKAHRQMIQAFKIISRRAPGWKLVLAGSIDPNQEFYIQELMRLGAGYEIDLMPNLSDSAISDLYAKSSIYWHATGVSLPTIPSAQEHMGIAPLEAQASGCVPIVYNSGGMPEVVRANETGLLFDNIADLPGVTLSLINNMAIWSKFSQAGQLWASSWMNFDNFVDRIDDMLNDRPIRPMVDWRPQMKYSASDVTVVVPTMGSALLTKCLTSFNRTAPQAHILIVNNSSENLVLDAGVDQTNIEILNPGVNTGYSGAMKLAQGIVKTPLVLMANDDLEALHAGWLENMILLMNNPTVGLVGAKLLFPDGRLQHAGGVLDFNREDIGYHRFYGQPDSVEASTPQEVDFCTGACLLVKKELFDVSDYLLDGLYMEEADLSLKAKQKGFKTIYQPAATLIHREGETRARSVESQAKIDHNRKAFLEKWGR